MEGPVATRAAPARAPEESHRYPVVGGAAAWALALLTVLLAVAAAIFHGIGVAAAAGALGWAVHRLSRSMIVETSRVGLTRGLLGLGAAFPARPTVISWTSIVEVRTAWRRPGDDSALESVVRDREGRAIRLSSAMGLAAYWACLAEIVRRAPAAARTGLTDRVLADGPPGPRDLMAAGRAAAALTLVLAAIVAVHYVWAQGSSSLARDLERASAERESRKP
jgi:hypothetical protein